MTAVKHAFTELPTIDIRNLAGDDLARRQAVTDTIDRAAREVGFFYITGHGIDPALIAGVRKAAKQIFVLPMGEKMDYHIGHSKSRKGYVPREEEVYGSGKSDHKEAFDIGFQAVDDHPLVPAGTPLIGASEQPDPPDFRTRVLAYYDVVFALSHRLFDAFALAFGLPEGYFRPMVTCPPTKLQLIHYPSDANVEDVPGIGAHTDYECFTLLLVDQPGPEVLNEESMWINAPPVKNAAGKEVFVINIGGMLEVLSASTFVATIHRVCKVPRKRCSSPLFFTCDYHTLIRPLPTFLAADEAGEYQELSIGEHMWSQALQTYHYLREKVNRGELQLPKRVRGTNTFGHLKKQAQQKNP